MIDFITRLFSNPACDTTNTVFGIPTWYKYLEGEADIVTGKCQLPTNFDQARFEQLPLIGLALVEILLFVIGLITVGFIIYGGALYMASQGEPDKTKRAKDTVMNAVIGLVIALFATTLVRFLGTRLGG